MTQQKKYKKKPDGKNATGRPKIKLTPEQMQQLEKFASCMTIENIAALFDFSDATLERRFKDDPEVLRFYKKGFNKSFAFVSGKLMQLISEGNPAAIFFWLKTRAGFKETQVVEQLPDKIAFTLNFENLQDKD